MLSVGQLKKHHLTTCLQQRKKLSTTTQNGLCRAVIRAFRWAEDEDIIQRFPFRGFKKPRQKQRTVVISEETYQFLLSRIPSENVRFLLELAWHTGARPHELRCLEL